MSANRRLQPRRSFVKAAAAVASLLPIGLLQACASPQPAATQSAASPAAAAKATTPAKPASTTAATQPAGNSAPAAGKTLRKVRYGDLKLISDAGIYIAMDAGYFAEQGIEIELVSFDSAANMVAPLGTGQIDAGGGAISAGLLNAFSRGVKMSIVADKGHSDPTPPGFPISIFMVRKALIDSGEVKTPADLKGRKYGYVSRGISTEVDLNAMMKQGGLTVNDLDMVQMGFADMIPAFASGAIDAAGPGEPFATNIAAQGTAVVFRRDYEVNPNNQVAALLFSPNMTSSDLATPFMIAYLRAVRLYNDAFRKQDAAARTKAIDALVKYTLVKDRALYDKMALQALHPNGEMNLKSMEEQQEYFLATGTQQNRVDLNQFIELKFIQQAAKELGEYK